MPTVENKKATKPHKPQPAAAPTHAWERQHNEPDRAWQAFVTYRDMGPGERSFTKLSRKLGKVRENFEWWSSRWAWVERCRQFDAWLDRKANEATAAEIVEMRKRHIQMAMSFQGAAALALNKIIKAEQAGVQLTLKPSEVRDLADLGLRIERLSRGEPTEQTMQLIETKPADDSGLTNLSKDELLTYRDLLLKTSKQ